MAAVERLQKILAGAGITSRRKAEELIRQGRVAVNGRVVTELGTKADPERDHIKLDGRLVGRARRKVYWLVNKPKGVICSVTDPQGRRTINDLLRSSERVFPVGRLDYNSEGLIILTNDGDLARAVAAAGENYPKVYHVKVRAIPARAQLDRLRAGIRLADGTQFGRARVRVLRQAAHAWLEVTLTEGKNREIRRMFEAIGHPVLKLKRVGIAFLTAAGLPIGRCRRLTAGEVLRLRTLVQ